MLSDVRSLEHPTLKVPYELLNKKFRGAQRNIDREVSQVQSSVKELETSVNSEGDRVTVGKITDLLSGVVERLNALKRKARECITDELAAAQCCKRRLEHLKEAGTNVDPNNPATMQWHRKRLDRMLVEHFLRCGYYDTALKLAKTADVEHLTNIDIFLVSKQVEESLRRQHTSECLAWCVDNRSKLRKIKSTLEFRLRRQEFVELIRVGRRIDAIKHARKHFTAIEDKEQLIALEHVMGLLAFPVDTPLEPYRTLLDTKCWSDLIDQFRQENFKLYNLNSTSVFAITLQSGLSALKTPLCYKKNGPKNPDCPICTGPLNGLALPLPCAHCSHSRLVCSISGQPLNEHNQPLVLPNGNVYGEIALKQMALENEGKVICQRTKQVYDFSELEKVYVM